MDFEEFGTPYVDIDEWRDPPIRHRYVHGGFEDSDTRFSFYFPPAESYGGRFIQFLEGGPAGHESIVANGAPRTDDALPHAFSLGAYLVESNQGHLGDDPGRPKTSDNTILSYRASAASAIQSKAMAAEMYDAAPHHGYVYGVSGGGVRSINCLEHGEGIWDGAVPCAIPHGGMFYALAEHAAGVLGDHVEQVVDGADVGSDGDVFAGLSNDQREALADLYRAGFARGAEFMLRPGFFPIGFGVSTLFQHAPGYFVSFWNEPGFLGHDDPARLEALLLNTTATVQQVLTAGQLVPPGLDEASADMLVRIMGVVDAPVGVLLDGLTETDMMKLGGADIVLTSGDASGRHLYCSNVVGPVALGSSYSMGGEGFGGVKPGDTVAIDNRNHVAFRFAYQ